MAVPVLTPEQRAAALAHAVEARTARTRMLTAVKTGSLTVAEVLTRASTDGVANRVMVVALVKAVPGLGPVRAKRLLDQLGIAPTRRVSGLGYRQRDALVAALT